MRRARVVGLLVLAHGVAVAVACSTFGDGEAPAQNDVGSESGGDDTGSDLDAEPRSDAADAAEDVGPARGCARPTDPAHFCDDFDVGGDIAFKWERTITDGGVIDETDAAWSTPRAVVASIPNGATTQTHAWLLKSKDGALDLSTKNRLTVSFMLRIPVVPFPSTGTGYMHALVVTFDSTNCDASASRAIELNFAKNDATMNIAMKGLVTGVCDGQNKSDFKAINGPFGMPYFKDDFRRVTLEVSRKACPSTAGAASVKATVDGVQSDCQTMAVDPFTKATTRLDVNVGMSAGQASPPARYIIDDVTIDAE